MIRVPTIPPLPTTVPTIPIPALAVAMTTPSRKGSMPTGLSHTAITASLAAARSTARPLASCTAVAGSASQQGAGHEACAFANARPAVWAVDAARVRAGEDAGGTLVAVLAALVAAGDEEHGRAVEGCAAHDAEADADG